MTRLATATQDNERVQPFDAPAGPTASTSAMVAGMRLRRGSEHFFNCIWDSSERDAPCEECLHRHFVGGVEGDAVGAALFCRFVGQAQAGKTLEVGLFEVEMAQGGEIKGQVRGRALRDRPARRGWAGACR